ncbi:hypothetical protein ACFL4N_09075, partial [Thermodesulfobacteriota bacterium]
MDGRVQDFLAYCSKIDFGPVNLSKEEKKIYEEFNRENILLCDSLPKSIRDRTKKFLKEYSGIEKDTEDDKSDFFKKYHAPAWSIIYWLTHPKLANDHLSEEDVKNAITAHTMALNLHSLDDHLNDGQIPTNHITLLLRSESWSRMTTAFDHLAAGEKAQMKIVKNFINDYYSSICGPEAVDSLDSYCDLFRRQMATWLMVPVLIANKVSDNLEFPDAVQSAYESFGIAWRLLDDLQDILIDLITDSHSAVYILLPEDMRRLWDNIFRDVSTIKIDHANDILDYIQANGIVEHLQKRACSELESAAVIAEGFKMKGLAEEFRCLAKPLKISLNEFVKAGIKQDKSPVDDRKVLSIEVTTRCNSACSHCFVRAGITEPSSLSFRVVKD